MRHLTPQGQQVVGDLAQRYGFSQDAVAHMLFAVLNGNGGMAQFGHPEFGGSGQWMQGGMLMLGDMFNYGLKSRVDSLCHDLSNILANQPGLLQAGSFQSQSQSGSGQQNQTTGVPMGQSSLFMPDPEEHWWPSDLGSPTSAGNQNNMRYAYFANGRRLAVKTGRQIWVYDTLDHQIGGFAQQQGGGSSITFSSQYGAISLASLPVVSRDGQPVQAQAAPHAPVPVNAPASGNAPSGDLLATLERLGELREKGILSEVEFAAKKADLLSRL